MSERFIEQLVPDRVEAVRPALVLRAVEQSAVVVGSR